MLNSLLANGANGMSDIEGKVAREAMSEWSRGDASDIDGQTDRSNGAFGKTDTEHVAIGSRAGRRQRS